MANFVRHESCPKCGSSDNLAIYDDGSYYCWSHCGHKKISQEYLDELKQNSKSSKKTNKKEANLQVKKTDESKLKPKISGFEVEEIKQFTYIEGSGYRGIEDWVNKYFGVRYEYNEDNEVQAQYYPITYDSELSGFKIRRHPKDFTSIGRTGKECDLFGQFRFKNPNKYCLLVGGELDQLSAYQMLRNYQIRRKNENYEAIPVVSPTVGETGSQKQISLHYEWFNMYERIILCYDNDEAGKKAMEDVITVLPKGKVYVMQMRHKDPNEYLTKGQEDDFIKDFYNAKKHVPTGVVGSNEISDAMREELVIPKIPLPPFMHRLSTMMAGGIPLGRIVNLAAASGIGKSTIVDELIYFWLFNSPHLCGVVTLESTVGQYGIKLLSRHISTKIELLDQDKALEYISTDDVKNKEYELFNTSEGEPRFYLVDDRGGGVENVQDAIENLVIACGCKLIILDPVSDVISALPTDQQDSFSAWQKEMVKSHNVTFINVCHTRKTGSGQKAGSTGADLNEEDIQGSSAMYKSAACNLMFSRNKEAEDDVERNTTTMKATKIRWTGNTGIAGKYYYDNSTHTLYDLEDYLEKHPELALGF